MRKAALLVLTALSLASCNEPSEQATEPARAPLVDTLDSQADQALTPALEAWRQALEAFTTGANDQTLATLTRQWRALYRTTNQFWLVLATRACGRDQLSSLERVDDWPLYPAYVDATPSWPESGIVNDQALPIRRDTLLEQHRMAAPGEVSLGFQPLWLLLHNGDGSPRAVSEFDTGSPITQRRHDYVRVAGTLLMDDLTPLQDANGVSAAELRCGLKLLDRRLRQARRWTADSKGETAEGDRMAPGESLAIVRETLPEAALAQLNGDDLAPLREALEKQKAGFRKALQQASESGQWAPISRWLNGDQGEP
ncbi:hypothetical protein B5T_00461 [Alloalcanivorax dieselolei B5]|uniref:Imelysin-like domain-containing protein n=1 Tax=Alcanivorax dieselolei (strain DSM 16502 / CGMCC 1.3690 / MCCC 1A00001 / B-5) TaxID=930169 RepID=K0CB97_ALCDB|nr:hypothetical protein [Alloalcanivorax dieselolei]AFT68746.1 hypothetical protein B5T_00461 [Alloalcanivorax dieselolei B5]GGK04808.1 hypothetical protein GCM10007426_36980 [Alloalcanivorax dieselolei]